MQSSFLPTFFKNGLRREELNKLSKKYYLQRGLNLEPLVVHSYASVTELTWQVLIEGYFILLLLVFQLTFGL